MSRTWPHCKSMQHQQDIIIVNTRRTSTPTTRISAQRTLHILSRERSHNHRVPNQTTRRRVRQDGSDSTRRQSVTSSHTCIVLFTPSLQMPPVHPFPSLFLLPFPSSLSPDPYHLPHIISRFLYYLSLNTHDTHIIDSFH